MRAPDWDKVAPEYFTHIQSPFAKGVKNPLPRILKSIPDARDKTVLEVGCGIGMLIPFLSGNFNRVVAIDISKKMIEMAKERNKSFENVEFHVMDMVDITRLKEKFDVVVCVNSIIMPNIVKVNKALKKINRVLKRGGKLIGIFPSLDSIIYQALITYDKEFEKRKDRRKAKRAAKRITSASHHDFCFGFFDRGGKQKHFYGFELDYRLRKANFTNIRIGKVHYPWKLIEEEPEPKRFDDKLYEELWDWVVSAQKK